MPKSRRIGDDPMEFDPKREARELVERLTWFHAHRRALEIEFKQLQIYLRAEGVGLSQLHDHWVDTVQNPTVVLLKALCERGHSAEAEAMVEWCEDDGLWGFLGELVDRHGRAREPYELESVYMGDAREQARRGRFTAGP